MLRRTTIVSVGKSASGAAPRPSRTWQAEHARATNNGPRPSRALTEAVAASQFSLKKEWPTKNGARCSSVKLRADSENASRVVSNAVVAPPESSSSVFAPVAAANAKMAATGKVERAGFPLAKKTGTRGKIRLSNWAVTLGLTGRVTIRPPLIWRRFAASGRPKIFLSRRGRAWNHRPEWPGQTAAGWP